MSRIIPPIDGISNKNTPKYVSVDITVEDNERILTVSANSDFLNRQGVVIESKGRLEDAESIVNSFVEHVLSSAKYCYNQLELEIKCLLRLYAQAKIADASGKRLTSNLLLDIEREHCSIEQLKSYIRGYHDIIESDIQYLAQASCLGIKEEKK